MDAISNLKAAVDQCGALHQQVSDLRALEAELAAKLNAASSGTLDPEHLLAGKPLDQHADLSRRLEAVRHHLRDAPDRLARAAEAAEIARQRALAAVLQGPKFDQARKAWADAIKAVDRAISVEALAAAVVRDEGVVGYIPNDPITEAWYWLEDFRSWRAQHH